MGQDPMYSIIVVCLNAGRRLCETVGSVLGQRCADFEVVVKDGGSSDGSVEMLAEAWQDARLRVYTEKDSGIYDAMNQAVKLAGGAYFLFLNAGDSFYDENVLDRITDEIHRLERAGRRADILYGNMYHKALEAVICASPEINDFTCYRNVPCHQTCFYRRALFESRGYRTKYTVRADYEHFCGAIMTGRLRSRMCPLWSRRTRAAGTRRQRRTESARGSSTGRSCSAIWEGRRRTGIV